MSKLNVYTFCASFPQITLIINPVSDARGEFIMDVPEGNQGGASLRYGSSIPCDDDDGRPTTCPPNSTSTIVMDDLVEVVNSPRAVMKIDIEGHEHRAFAHADRLFESVQVIAMRSRGGNFSDLGNPSTAELPDESHTPNVTAEG
jgi:hypothetical protein